MKKPIKKHSRSEDRSHLRKKVNRLSAFEVYWYLYFIRHNDSINRFELDEIIAKDDKTSKQRLLKFLYENRLTTKFLDGLKTNNAEYIIPSSQVDWFYKDTRASLWLYMVLYENNINYILNIINTKSDIETFAHNFIFNINLRIFDTKLSKSDESTIEDLVDSKKRVVKFLKNVYFDTMLTSNQMAWLDKNNSQQINYIYKYMKKNNERFNDYKPNVINSKKTSKVSNEKLLMCSEDIIFNEADISLKYFHILASFDCFIFRYLPMNLSLSKCEYIDQLHEDRTRFINRTRQAWNSKAKRNRDKEKSKLKERVLLNNKNMNILTHLAEQKGITQSEMLNQIFEYYIDINDIGFNTEET